MDLCLLFNIEEIVLMCIVCDAECLSFITQTIDTHTGPFNFIYFIQNETYLHIINCIHKKEVHSPLQLAYKQRMMLHKDVQHTQKNAFCLFSQVKGFWCLTFLFNLWFFFYLGFCLFLWLINTVILCTIPKNYYTKKCFNTFFFVHSVFGLLKSRINLTQIYCIKKNVPGKSIKETE